MPYLSQLIATFRSSPLQRPFFRRFYIGVVCTALGYTVQATVSAWLMATLTTSEFMVALVQSASIVPTLLFGLLAGTLADIVGKRRMLIVSHLLMLGGATVAGIAAWSGVIAPFSLLFLVFVVGTGFAFYHPAQQAAINELVEPEQLSRAIGLGALAFNISRAVGPALAGMTVALLGSGKVMLSAAIMFVPMLQTIVRRRKAEPVQRDDRESILSGIVSGLRFARESTAMRAYLLRAIGFGSCAGAVWALLPVIARDQLHLDAGGFGVLAGCFGTGAIVGAITLTGHMKRFTLKRLIGYGTLLSAVSTLLIALTETPALAFVGSAGAGMAWVSVFAPLTTATQRHAPRWVRSRAVALYLVSVQGSVAAGSALWGAVASAAGTHFALAASAITALGIQLLLNRIDLDQPETSPEGVPGTRPLGEAE